MLRRYLMRSAGVAGTIAIAVVLSAGAAAAEECHDQGVVNGGHTTYQGGGNNNQRGYWRWGTGAWEVGWYTEDPDGPRTIRGLQKGAGCRYDSVVPVTYLSCAQYPDNLSGCGHGTQTEQPSTGANPDDQLSALYMRINGDPLHRSMAQFLGWSRANDAVAECMRGEGLTYQPTFVDAWVGHASVITSEETWTAPLHWRVVGQNAQGAVPMNRLLGRLMAPPKEGSPAASGEYQRSLAQCQAVSPPPSDDVPRDAMAQLTRLYTEAIGPAEASGPPVSEYEECMKGAGFDLSSSEDGGYQGLLEQLESSLPPQDHIPLAGEEPTAAWRRYLRFEQEALDTDAGCRAVGHETAMRVLEPLLAQFTDEHADELSRLDQQWASIEQQARDAGWTPDPYRGGATRPQPLAGVSATRSRSAATSVPQPRSRRECARPLTQGHQGADITRSGLACRDGQRRLLSNGASGGVAPSGEDVRGSPWV